MKVIYCDDCKKEITGDISPVYSWSIMVNMTNNQSKDQEDPEDLYRYINIKINLGDYIRDSELIHPDLCPSCAKKFILTHINSRL